MIQNDSAKMQQSTYPETADIETSSDDYARRFAGDIGRYFLTSQSDILLSLITDLAGRRLKILDVGGAHAQLAIPLTQKGHDVTVTGSHDICGKRLAEKLPEGSYRYLTCDSLDLPFADNDFDLVISFRLVPHVENWQRLLAELSRVSRQAVIIDYPDIRSTNILNFLFFRLKKALEGNTRPFGLFSRKQIIEAFAANGMTAPQLVPEFFLPMVLHRKVGKASLSRSAETICRRCGLTRLFGSPIILRVDKKGLQS